MKKFLKNLKKSYRKKATKLQKYYRKHKVDIWCIAAIIAITGLSHGLNFTQYPYYENDEATYISRGWSVVSDGKLDPYTYRYDHAPVGWLVISVWQTATLGTAIFGSFLTSGRVLMLLIAIATAVLTYLLGKRLTGSYKASIIAVLLVAISPLAIYFQRRVLLDNVMTLFILLAMYFASDPKRRLGSFQLSALMFGLAILSKLAAVFALPALLLLVIFRSQKVNRLHVLVQWIGIVALVVSLFITYAALKGELFPASLDANGRPTHVSLIETTEEQLSRGVAKLPWAKDSSFAQNMGDWFRRDTFLMLSGMLAIIATLIIGIKNRMALVIAVYCLGFMFFFARGKLVLNHYLLPILPGLALALAVVMAKVKGLLDSFIKPKEIKLGILVGVLLSLGGIYAWYYQTSPYRVDENSNLIAAQNWVLENVDKQSVIITDNYAYPDLQDKHGYEDVYYMFPAEYDPAVRREYNNDWRNIDYILVTHEVYKQMENGTLPTIKEAYAHAYPVMEFSSNTTSYIDHANLISTNGDWAAIYKVDPNFINEVLIVK